MNDILLEVCLDSVSSAIAAREGGADRIELCANLGVGGTTPPMQLVGAVRRAITIPMNVMIRPRAGNFRYDDTEFEAMKQEIVQAKSAGADGVVLGILDAHYAVDVDRTRKLTDLARPMAVTFHRAFDEASDPAAALEGVIEAGADRLLTSGQAKSAVEGSPLIARLVRQASGRILLMAGCGIRHNNLEEVIYQTGVREIHIGRAAMGDDGVVDASLVKTFLQVCRNPKPVHRINSR